MGSPLKKKKERVEKERERKRKKITDLSSTPWGCTLHIVCGSWVERLVKRGGDTSNRWAMALWRFYERIFDKDKGAV